MYAKIPLKFRIDMLYTEHIEGGRGLVSIGANVQDETFKLQEYIRKIDGPKGWRAQWMSKLKTHPLVLSQTDRWCGQILSKTRESKSETRRRISEIAGLEHFSTHHQYAQHHHVSVNFMCSFSHFYVLQGQCLLNKYPEGCTWVLHVGMETQAQSNSKYC